MSDETEINLASGVLDHQLMDSQGRRCGRVDDLEIREGDEPAVEAILFGPPVRRGRVRGPFARFLAGLGPIHTSKVSWLEVDRVGPAIHLRHTADELGLRTADDRLLEWAAGLRRR
jgi:hypothetical protein